MLELVQQAWPCQDWLSAEILVAVSGGPDSLALLHLLYQAKARAKENVQDIQIVHVDHQVRKTSERDRIFVEGVAHRLGIIAHFVERSGENNVASIEVACSENSMRDFRYQSMLDVAHRQGIRFLVTAHHADDQTETVLFRLVRGTGLYGLQGIPTVRVQQGVSIVRPLLRCTKLQLREFLRSLGQDYCIDESNADSGYARNYLRNDVIPALSEKFGGQFQQSLARIANQAGKHIELLDHLAQPLIRNVEDCFFVDGIKTAHPVLAIHALRMIWTDCGLEQAGMSADKWEQLLHFILRDSDGHLQLPGRVTARLVESRLKFDRTSFKR